MAIGPVSLDHNIGYQGNGRKEAGGAVAASGFAAARSGNRTALFTKLPHDADVTGRTEAAKLPHSWGRRRSSSPIAPGCWPETAGGATPVPSRPGTSPAAPGGRYRLCGLHHGAPAGGHCRGFAVLYGAGLFEDGPQPLPGHPAGRAGSHQGVLLSRYRVLTNRKHIDGRYGGHLYFHNARIF